MRVAVQLDACSFRYAGAEQAALRNISLNIPDGQICGVVGRADAGKTTLCALLAGFIPHFYRGDLRGSVLVDRQDVLARPVPELVQHVALVSSNAFSQISGARFRVADEIGFALENIGLPRDVMHERIAWALEAMHITHLADRSPYALSGGQQQRLVIAAALALRPAVLVLDEPTAQLDPPATEELSELLRLLANQGTTIVVAEHRLEWIAELVDRVVVLEAGQVIADGTPDTVLVDPLMRAHGIGQPRAAVIAERARSVGWWQLPYLPSMRAALVAGLREHLPETIPSPPAAPVAATGGAPIVQLEQVGFRYPSGVDALSGVTLQIGAGERIALLGPNGAGKSTLIRQMNGLLRPTSGRVLVAGQDTRAISVARAARHVAIVFQNVRTQLFAKSVREEVRFGPRNLKYSQAESERLVDSALELLGLRAVAAEHPYDLSVVQRRLVAIAAAVAMNPQLLLLDEPTAGLDAAAIERVAEVIEYQAQQGHSTIVISHDLDFCFDHLHRITLLAAGQLVLDQYVGELHTDQFATIKQLVGLPLEQQVIADLDLSHRDPRAQLITSVAGFSAEHGG